IGPTLARLFTHAFRPGGSSVAPRQEGTGSPGGTGSPRSGTGALYQVRFLLLATNVKVSWIVVGCAGTPPVRSVSLVIAMSVVQLAPTPQPSVGFNRCRSTRVSGVQNMLVGPVGVASVMSGLSALRPLWVARVGSSAGTQAPAESPAVGTMLSGCGGAG